MGEIKGLKICHMTSAHHSEDVRIFHKECVSLAYAGYEVYLVERGESYDKDGVHVVGVGEIPESRRKRMILGARKVYEKALALDCDLYHLHDPELLRFGLKLKNRGKLVLFDSHEDVPSQILQKSYIPSVFRKIIAAFYKTYETHIVKHLDGVVAATPFIAELFRPKAKRVVDINNYPKLDEIKGSSVPFSERKRIVCYAGGINDIRGERTMVEAMRKVNGTLIIAGAHEKKEINYGNSTVKYVGFLNRQEVNALYGQAIVGLCMLKPVPNYVNSQPIKMYEYMAAGIPFICSNFPLWEKVVSNSRAGICLNPEDVDGLASKIQYLLDNPAVAEEMGKNGKICVNENYSWANEEKKLVKMYNAILCNKEEGEKSV